MSGIETFFLGLVIVGMVAFAVVLAYAVHETNTTSDA